MEAEPVKETGNKDSAIDVNETDDVEVNKHKEANRYIRQKRYIEKYNSAGTYW